MYTLISHGSRIQVARFQNASDVFHGPDTEVSEKEISKETIVKEKSETEFKPDQIESKIASIRYMEQQEENETKWASNKELNSAFETQFPSESEESPRVG